MSLPWIVTTLTLVACGRPTGITQPHSLRVVFSPDIPHEQVVLIQDAISVLNATIGVSVVRDTGDYPVALSVDGVGYLSNTTLGQARQLTTGCELIIAQKVFTSYIDTLRTVVFHELGHCLSMHHVSKETGEVMSPRVLPFPNISDEAIDRFRQDVLEHIR